MHKGSFSANTERRRTVFKFLKKAALAIVSMKSFGDFIIARWALRKFGVAYGNSLLYGEHLADLDLALGKFPGGCRIAHGEPSVPAMFDSQRAGLKRSIASAARLRRSMGGLAVPKGTTLVFDRLGVRERFIAGRFYARALPVADNIYLAYCALFDASLAEDTAFPTMLAHTKKTVGIFPGSRLAAKTLATETILLLTELTRSCGGAVRIFCLEGEACDLTPDAYDLTIVPRNFRAMADAVRSVDGVISADSMPAHMAEYFAMPVFVVSPVANKYWLPLSCFVAGHWSLSTDPVSLRDSLRAFLSPNTYV